MLPQKDAANHHANKKQEKIAQDDDDADEVFYNDVMELSPSEFFSKYTSADDSIYVNDDFNSMGIEVPKRVATIKRKANFHDISTDVLCYIILTYLDWRTVFSGCLSVSKEFFRRIANNRVLFINLYNELFVMKQEEIDTLKINSSFKHKKYNVEGFTEYTGFGIPNENYHFCGDYDNSSPHQSEFNAIHNLLKKHHVKNRRMTDAKLRLIREKWNNAISVYKKSKNMKQTTSKKEENQALLVLIKRIIKDRLFMRKFFNKDFKSVKLWHLHHSHFFKNGVGYEEAYKQSINQLSLKEQVERLVIGEDKYEMNELEEIVIGNFNNSYSPTDEFIRCLANYSYVDCETIVSFLANDIPDRQKMISTLSTSDIKPIFTTFPNLKAFMSRGQFANISNIKNINLVVLILTTGGMRAETLNGILNCEFPQLKHLELWFGSYSYGNSIHANDLEELLSPEENGRYPLLEYFGIRNSQNVDQFLTPIANSNLLKRLRILDLSLCGVSTTAPTLLDFSKMLERKTRSSFPLLELVDIHRNYVTNQDRDEIIQIFDRLGIVVDISLTYCRYIAVGE